MLQIITGVTKIRSLLGTLSINTKEHAISWLHLRSIIGSKDIGDRLTAEATRTLEELGEATPETEEGLKVQRVVKKIKTYNETPAVIKATEAVKKAKKTLDAREKALEAAREKAGFEEKDGKPYYQAVK